tara:strand:- start:295 stop:489 length:195 start_codon:yes stop_codon:yes gene_type:complete
MLNWLFGNNIDRENSTVVKALKSKGTSKTVVPITVGDIKRGIAVDSNGYNNEVVLFLRKNKKDR